MVTKTRFRVKCHYGIIVSLWRHRMHLPPHFWRDAQFTSRSLYSLNFMLRNRCVIMLRISHTVQRWHMAYRYPCKLREKMYNSDQHRTFKRYKQLYQSKDSLITLWSKFDHRKLSLTLDSSQKRLLRVVLNSFPESSEVVDHISWESESIHNRFAANDRKSSCKCTRLTSRLIFVSFGGKQRQWNCLSLSPYLHRISCALRVALKMQHEVEKNSHRECCDRHGKRLFPLRND